MERSYGAPAASTRLGGPSPAPSARSQGFPKMLVDKYRCCTARAAVATALQLRGAAAAWHLELACCWHPVSAAGLRGSASFPLQAW